MKRTAFLFLAQFIAFISHAATITGTITSENGDILPFASIIVKGTSKGAIANSQGKYSLTLPEGRYSLICQFVGYKADEKTVTVNSESVIMDFRLSVQEFNMKEVVIKKGEDPALEIMRQTIRKRKFYNEQVDSFLVDVYIKGLMRSRALPNKIFGQEIDRSDLAREGIDSAGKGILFLSESVTRVSFTKPDNIKYQVLSSRQSGGGFGFDFPFFINFYENNVKVIQTNPRGFISPISENAFHYYRFRFEGNFFEDNRMISRIRVIPKRKNEPLFDGYMQIIDSEWRIHSVDLLVTASQGLELLDTVKITQMHQPVTNEVWKTGNQVLYVAVKKFGVDMAGNFLNVYSNYNIDPGFGKKHFNRVIMTYDSTANKKDSAYWSAIRPVPLEPDEKKDFVFKDSIRKADRDSFSRLNLDSLNKKQKPVKFVDIFTGNGVSRRHYTSGALLTYKLKPLVKQLEYNSVEGIVINIRQSIDVWTRKSRYNYSIGADARYGVSNEHFNGFGTIRISSKTLSFRQRYLEFSGGKRVSQFNRDNPIDPLTNSLYTLLAKKNYMKIFENYFGTVAYNNKFESGFQLNVQANWEDRIPLENTIGYTFFKKERSLLPNHPYELAHIPFLRHQALVAEVNLSFQPGQTYIQYPYYKQPMGSKYPTLELSYSKGISNVLGSDVDYDKWKFSVFDDANLRIGGTFRYRFIVGGFLNAKKVEIPDYQHFNGNQTFYNFKYLNSFQLAPYYRYSNTETFFAVAHVEHHFNGLITNKIPLFNKLKWYLVAGANTFYVNRNNYYMEVFGGLENIFKAIRVDFVAAYQAQPGRSVGIRIGLGGILGNVINLSMD